MKYSISSAYFIVIMQLQSEASNILKEVFLFVSLDYNEFHFVLNYVPPCMYPVCILYYLKLNFFFLT